MTLQQASERPARHPAAIPPLKVAAFYSTWVNGSSIVGASFWGEIEGEAVTARRSGHARVVQHSEFFTYTTEQPVRQLLAIGKQFVTNPTSYYLAQQLRSKQPAMMAAQRLAGGRSCSTAASRDRRPYRNQRGALCQACFSHPVGLVSSISTLGSRQAPGRSAAAAAADVSSGSSGRSTGGASSCCFRSSHQQQQQLPGVMPRRSTRLTPLGRPPAVGGGGGSSGGEAGGEGAYEEDVDELQRLMFDSKIFNSKLVMTEFDG